MSGVLSRLGFPSIGRHRLFVTAIGIDALGSGVWMPLSVLYFVRVTHLNLVQVGVALSVAAALSFPLALVIGSLVDRFDAKRVLQGGNVLQAVGFAAYPLAHSVLAVTLVVAIAALGRTAFWGSYSPMVAAVSEAGEREKWFGFLGALRNSGFAVGGLLAAAAITIGTDDAFHAVVLLNAASYVLALVLMVRVQVHGVHRDGVRQRQGGGWSEVARDPGYRWLVGANFGYAMGCLALNVVMPVYIVHMLGLQGWVSGAVYVINTVLIGVGQGLIVRRMTGCGALADRGARGRPDDRRLPAHVRSPGDAIAGELSSGRRDRGGAGGSRGLHARRDGRWTGARCPRRRVTPGPPARPLPRGLPALVERRVRRRAGALPLPAPPGEPRGLGGPVRAGALRRGLLPPAASADATGGRARDQHGPGADRGLTHVAG